VHVNPYVARGLDSKKVNLRKEQACFQTYSGNVTPFVINYLMRWYQIDFEGMILCWESIDFCNCWMIKK
jgi:hypothetical protein